MEHLKELISNHLEKDFEIELNGKTESCSFLDWNQIIADHENWVEGIEGMSEEKRTIIAIIR